MRLPGSSQRAAAPAGSGRRRHRLASLAAAVLCLGGTVLGVESSSAHPAAASIGSDKSRIAQLEHQIVQEGNEVEDLVSRADEVQGQLDDVDERIVVAKSKLAGERSAYAVAAAELGEVAVEAYVNGGSVAGTWAGSSDAAISVEQQVYAGVADGNLAQAMNAMELVERQLTSTENALKSDEASLTATLAQLATARRQAETAIDEDEQTLSQVKGNLLHLVLAQAQREEAAQEAAEEKQEAEEAAQKAAEQPPPPPPPVVTTTTTPPSSSSPSGSSSAPSGSGSPVSGGGYADPLRDVSALSPERIDMGVDYSGYGPIYAIGDGIVLCTVNGGWPGGTFIVYQLTDGPASGLYVYAAEDINPDVSPGQTVTPNTVLGQIYEGPDGIETGWADGSALGDTMAAVAGQFDGSNSTAFGYNFSQLLESVGAPGGILQNSPATGSLPANWPEW